MYSWAWYLPISPYISLYLPISPCISLMHSWAWLIMHLTNPNPIRTRALALTLTQPLTRKDLMKS